MSIVIEVASYPKCGNTWMRSILSRIFDLNVHFDIPDIHQQHEKTRSMMMPVHLNNEYYFYKSHNFNHKQMNPDRILLIYRHPLDVFMSSLNYMYITERKDFFKDGILRSVDDLKKEGLFDQYFDDYIEDMGSSFFSSLLGVYSNYKMYLEKVLSLRNIYPIRYEDLIDNPVASIEDLFKRLLLEERINISLEIFEKVNDNTIKSGKSFFWKAKKEVYKEYLNNIQINKFYYKYSKFLLSIGY